MTLERISGEAAWAEQWCQRLRAAASETRVLLLLAGTDTAAVPGISAAGATPESRRFTAAADAELLWQGPAARRPHALPPLPAGVSPALIAWAVLEGLALEPLVLNLGAPVAPAIPHLQLNPSPARCLSGGQAMDPERVQALWGWGERWGRGLARSGQPVLLSECVPGGTTTALAVLEALGIPSMGLVSGSVRQPDHQLKARLVQRGLAAAQLAADASPQAVLAAVGDPMQVVAAALLKQAALAGTPLLLAGGSQMAAVLALALAACTPPERQQLCQQAAVVTTAWVAHEAASDFPGLMQQLAQRFAVQPLAFATGLRFTESRCPELLDYERGYVKEGVGAGGLAALWQLSGRSLQALQEACEQACDQLQHPA
ncbi:nicotinate mononucleotide-dependent phosphoribosyltransferase CobT [Vulcanococcus sp. DEBay_Sum22DG08_74]|uniref:nicotinate mononucleotide-dependent phosphoribosyltransferase CobT n=1 Tax=Vulcanococcus sp. DEBay_Sum22DG08_74 TaxID=2806299 RepID=UPI0025ECF3D6|nr:TIGR00303 family protein [Vulcanococcus sp. DEBay_Sum22DG08_74]